jgi:hypothetical protein
MRRKTLSGFAAHFALGPRSAMQLSLHAVEDERKKAISCQRRSSWRFLSA